LRACGFHFERDEDALLILASTNYHTKLIQYFCKHLVRRIHGKQFRAAPPYPIKRSDIEAISQAGTYSEELRKIFDATMRVDIENRYRAVVLSLAFEQGNGSKAYASSYTPKEIVEKVSQWSPEAFPNRSFASDDLQCLLSEMCGMGLLARDKIGKFRLRSPNLVRLLGDRKSIEHQLLELEKLTVHLRADSESARGHLDGSNSYSCFTYLQERGVRQAASGVVLVMGSQAHGLDLLEPAVSRSGPNLDAPCVVVPPEEAHSPGKLRDWLNKRLLPLAQKSGAGTAVQYLAANDPKLKDFVEQSIDFARHHQSDKRSVRVVLVMPPKTLLDWIRLPESERTRLEAGCDFLLRMRRWNASGLRQRFMDQALSIGDTEMERVIDITGGWHFLVERFFQRLKRQRDLARELDDFQGQWQSGIQRMERRSLSSSG
jgi:hypothetical protein